MTKIGLNGAGAGMIEMPRILMHIDSIFFAGEPIAIEPSSNLWLTLYYHQGNF